MVHIVKISHSIKQRENDILITNRPFFDYAPLIPELESNGPELGLARKVQYMSYYRQNFNNVEMATL